MQVSIFQSSQERINAKKEAATRAGKAKKRERSIRGGASKAAHLFSIPRHRSPKPNHSNRIEGQNWHIKYRFPPTSPCSAVL